MAEDKDCSEGPKVDCQDASVITSTKLQPLSEEQHALLKKQESRGLVSEFKRLKLEQEAAKNWDKFYKRNETRFYKDRHWTTREFKELVGCVQDGKQKVLFEIGCGVGNFFYPLIEDGLDWYVHACDFSQRAIDFVKSHQLYDDSRVHAFVHDITSSSLSEQVPDGSVDIVSLIFVLSAINPDKLCSVVKNISQCVRDGGMVIIRDYGRYDIAQLRFGAGHKLSENFYVRQDGTRAYYFTTDELTSLFTEAGFDVTSCEYVSRRTVNKKEGVDVSRTFVQGKFRRRAR
ncbi:tRNA N(3)-methylcytidine methyltransferase METTL6-like [Amphibalanus amphitrite]|uniref:tRNA N(3)-methylcytidine methyltransferase METTL6-like n=1 Tax=Amphibalanus amphitrite TaxID=1232801 RepID=UPI001C90BFCB|nr:tRNA N(3)-methylcytidine methyltransferase METTL6-like [Amphibalanus amphitrite]XP_043195062.1 tRNA N(3)-methylcytidine methyltransferase METTL6-like [Amphibalanus amphitrite]XP_043195063.1 tRNA N(3)-methylcytidine methyltransferase METTL6-like [Amphibalanus amphitrite]XP_043195064.1 tRNA N(3)-methylcytidine methyltransferase METTL6-like [Amphibalanus amphitrite]XP_043195065.1 tRNA N(3)-methylcytidine methyltransferase METTL6-like [Amphibalanus amphitrite]